MAGGDAAPAAAPADEAAAATAEAPAEAAPAEAEASSEKKAKLTAVKVETIKKGKGHLCKDSQIASMQYTGMLYADESKVFDSNEGGEDFQFTVGGYTVIKCWQTAIMQMHVGEKAKIYCPSSTAYGHSSPSAKIPKDSDLVFTVQANKCEEMF